jgi:hypothetical protein
MPWEEEMFAVLDDLEQQAESLYAADRELELADRTRAEYHHVTLASRLMASVGQDLVVDVQGVGAVAGALERVGDGWCWLRGPAQDWVLRTAAVSRVRDASPRSVPEVAWSPVARLGLGSALRRIADTGEPCVLHLLDGTAHESWLLRVGADFVETGTGDQPERGAHRQLVAFTALAAVQSRD